MRHFDFQGPILQTRPAEAAAPSAAPALLHARWCSGLAGSQIPTRFGGNCLTG